MGVWDVATPAGSDPVSQGDDRIRELKVAVQEALQGQAAEGDEAVFPGSSPLTAPLFRYRGLKGSTDSRPTASQGGLYYNTDSGTIQRANGSSWDDLTENAAFEAIHQKTTAALASVGGVITLPETGNSFNVSGTEAITSIAGWSAGLVIIKWGSARTITHASTLYLLGAINRSVAANDVSIFEFTGADSVREIAFYGNLQAPTRQYLTSGSSQTYTTPAGCRKILVKMKGGGGGGAANDTNNGGDGGATSFNSIFANGGAKGIAGATGADGAGGTGGSGSAGLRIAGAKGALRPRTNNSDGIAAPANSGIGGSGAMYGGNGSGSGGDGEYVEISIASPASTYTYTVGAGGSGGSVSNQAGGAGGSGLIVVEESY